ncbi:hypothetical protein I316_01734 [Kwoniella heveanensis BCC8398]|uniref:Uncharacterized protein n=1 Tax=Kwoniella heveanensis BCC8398 TaxID=1296120 RepID=A0A1B9GZP5_9TREE|nr:hypothetical protein I316_01734 [Kwoniella heveanensis BCC8398]
MEVDTDRAITDDERMDEDYPVGEGEAGMMEDSDGDEMMGDEIQDDQEYEEAMDEENMEPELHTTQAKETEVVPPVENPLSAVGVSEPPIPFTPTQTPPVVTPFPDPASSASAGFFGPGSVAASASGSTSARPFESPPAPETEMTPVPQDGHSHTVSEDTSEEVTTSTSEQPRPPLNADDEGKEHVSHPPQTVATTEEALDVLKTHPSAADEASSTSLTHPSADDMPAQTASIPTVPEPPSNGGIVPVEAESSKRVLSGGPTSASGAKDIERVSDVDEGHDLGVEDAEEDLEVYYDDEDAGEEGGGEENEDDEDYSIDVLNLPPVIVHLPHSGARSLFVPYESDPDTLPIWLRDRQEELGEASLADVWDAIRAECVREGLGKNGALVITEKQMDLKMNEDDVNLQSITFLELITLHHECGLPEPVQLYLTWEESRFITRFNAIQSELEAVRRRRSGSAQTEGDEQIEPDAAHAEKQQAAARVQAVPANTETSSAVVPATSPTPAPALRQPVKEADTVAEAEEVDYEVYDDEEYAEEARSIGAGGYSDTEEASKAARAEKREQDRERHREGREVKAEYAESNDEKNTRDLEREHPHWAEARARPTDALHYEGPSTKRHIIYHQDEQHEPEALATKADQAPDPESAEPIEHTDVKGGEDVGAGEGNEEYEDQEEEREDGVEDDAEEGGDWNDDGGTVDSAQATHDEQTESKQTEGEEDDMQATVPVPIRISKAEAERLRAEQQTRLAQLRHEGLGQQQEVGSVIAGSGAALPTPAAGTTASTQAGVNQVADKAPLDEVALQYKYTGTPDGSAAQASLRIDKDADAQTTEEAEQDAEYNDLVQPEVPLDEVALKLEADSAQDESAAISPVGSSRDVSESQYQSQFATPAETTPMGTEISLTASEVGGAHAIADRVLGADGVSFQRPEVILEEEDEITISEREQIVNDRAERRREVEELPAPVDGVAGAGLVPETAYEDDNEASYEEDEYPGAEEYIDEGYAAGEYDDSDLPGTMPVTPLETETGEEGSLKFYPQGHPDADEQVGDSDGQADEGYSEEYEEEGSERTLEEDDDDTFDSYIVSADPTMTESGDTDYPTSTADDSHTAPPSAKRTLDDDESLESKRARTDETSE